jgi:Glycosyl hydrolase family 26
MQKPIQKQAAVVMSLILAFAGAGSAAVLTHKHAHTPTLSKKFAAAVQHEKQLGPKRTPRWYWRWTEWRLGEGYARGRRLQASLRPVRAPQRIPTWAWRRLHFFLLARSARARILAAQGNQYGRKRKRTQTGTTTTAPTTTATNPTTTTSPVPIVAGAAPPVPASGAYFGARAKPLVSGETEIQAADAFEQLIGRRMDIDHYFVSSASALPTPEMIASSQAGRYPLVDWDMTDWSTIAAGGDDAAIRQSAQAVAAWGKPCFLNFDHEPEGESQNPADYVAAWRHIVTIFRESGAKNVSWVWMMMANTFATPSEAASYYPGDDYVDWLAADGYNWYPAKSGSSWRSFAQVFSNFKSWATTHASKPVMVAETGAQEDPTDPNRKAQWLIDALAAMKQWPQAHAWVYWNSNRIYPWMADTSPASLNAFKEIGSDPYFNIR